ncbi:hypothetical protein [Pseudomonas aeruginosa]|uniref:hypothetical protein n=1 Tax=Pseudomonas aeruginosa TaxID=287 RepID=UPI0021ADB2AE|nr:hypothetical protein [Pseudomonas aeruginosa]
MSMELNKESVEQAGANVGHGHVFPRADGVKMRCGGPGLCSECTADASRARAALAQPSPAQAEAERPELWAVHAQGPDELYAAFTREDAEKHAAELNALPMPEGIAVGAVVVPSPWPAVQHWQYLAEQEQDHKSEIAARLRQLERICEGLPQDAIDGGWTAQGIRGYAKRLEDQLKAALARIEGLTASRPVPVEEALRKLRAVLCDPVGNVVIDGSDGDREEVQRALGMLAAAPGNSAQHSVPVGWKLVECGIWTQEQVDEMQKTVARFRNSEFVDDRALAMAVADAGQCKAPEISLAELLAAAPGKEVPQAWIDVQAERRRQIEAEGWTPKHDDEHSHGQMARAAACYALAGSSAPNDETAALLVSLAWPWDEQWWKPSTARRDLVKACALALAEIERLDRATATQGGPRDA